jgi:ATP-binding protein involved in chromosome partitioning
MAFDKQLIAGALAGVRGAGSAGGGGGEDPDAAARLRHIAACDGHTTIRLAAADLDVGSIDALAAACGQAIANRCAAAGERLLGLTIEFVDDGGTMIRGAQFGAGAGGQGAGAGPGGAVAGASGGGGGGGGGGQAGGGGHRPIAGLKPAESGGGALGGGGMARHIIAVGAGKGGVGKSSVAVNLAVGLARKGHAVGLMDGDIYGPSIPTMLGLHEQEQAVLAGMLQPFYVHGVKAITIGKLVDPDRPLIWRGPMAHGAFKQLVEQTAWGDLDYLVIDLPPGTGDVSLTMSQMLRLTGAVVVCTPQRVAQDDAIRAVRMFQQLGIEVLGVVENMSSFVGDDGKEYDIFGKGGAEKMAARLNLPFLGAVPITMALRENSDRGDPTANFQGKTRLASALESLVDTIERQASLAAVRQGQSKPTLNVS